MRSSVWPNENQPNSATRTAPHRERVPLERVHHDGRRTHIDRREAFPIDLFGVEQIGVAHVHSDDRVHAEGGDGDG
jgi:hypothetical protein